jgi:Zn-dependent protease with chaperone function
MDMANFFERQEEARRNTAQLVATYGLTVVFLALGLYVTAVLLLEEAFVFRPWVLGGVVGGVALLIGVARWHELSALRRGGHVVAQRLGGRRLDPSGGARRQLINVVEEMAIAAGIPAPSVYVLPERGINALSAGFTQDDAMIGVTQGAIDHLRREELQGVVAHELSHLLNGDTALNLRLMSWMRGIELVRDLGYGILWTASVLPRKFARGAWAWTWAWTKGIVDWVRWLANQGIGGLVILAGCLWFFGGFLLMVTLGPMLLVGEALGSVIRSSPIIRSVVIVGIAGTGLGGLCHLGARIIKAQVSREREFLADAAAVQFTRNPKGLGRALRKHRNCEEGGHVRAPGAKAVQHLFFGQAVGPDDLLARSMATLGWLSPHPPVEKRIDRVAPSLLDEEPSMGPDRTDKTDGEAASEESFTPEDLVERAGTLNSTMLEEAQALRAATPDPLLRAAHDPLGAVAVSYALLLDDDATIQERQYDLLWERVPVAVYEETKRLFGHVPALDRSQALPLVEVAAPSLRNLSTEQQDQAHRILRALAAADERLTLFEFALETVVRHTFEPVDPGEHAPLPAVREAALVLLAGVAQAEHPDGANGEAEAAFEAGAQFLVAEHGLTDATYEPVGPDEMDTALDRMARASPNVKKTVLAACARCATADDQMRRAAEDLLRAVAAAMGVPLPLSVVEQAGSYAEASGA